MAREIQDLGPVRELEMRVSVRADNAQMWEEGGSKIAERAKNTS